MCRYKLIDRIAVWVSILISAVVVVMLAVFFAELHRMEQKIDDSTQLVRLENAKDKEGILKIVTEEVKQRGENDLLVFDTLQANTELNKSAGELLHTMLNAGRKK